MKTISKVLCCVTFICNSFLSLVACLLVGYGVWLLVPIIHVWSENFIITTFIILLSFGIMISLASMSACLGVCKTNCGILFASASFNTFNLTLILNFIIGLCFFRHDIEEKVQSDMFQSLADYNRSLTNGYSSPGWDMLQSAYGCCGVVEYQDWLNKSEKFVPYPCSMEAKRDKQPINFLEEIRKTELPNFINTVGCFKTFQRNAEENSMLIILGCGIFELVIILSIVLTCYLGKKIRDNDMYEPQLANEDFELTNIVRKSHQKGRNPNGTLKGARIDVLRGIDNPYPSLTHSIHDERLINYTKL